MCDVRPNCFKDNFFLTKQRIQKILLRTYIVNSWLINNESAIIYVSRFSNGEYLVRCICQMQLASPSNLKQKECVYSSNQLVHTKIMDVTRFTYTTINYFVWIFEMMLLQQNNKTCEVMKYFLFLNWKNDLWRLNALFEKAARKKIVSIWVTKKFRIILSMRKTWSCNFNEDATLFETLILSSIWIIRVI